MSPEAFFFLFSPFGDASKAGQKRKKNACEKERKLRKVRFT